jgi:hypothetical protein
VCVPVLVRIDGALEAGDQLIRSRVDGPAAGDVLLPAGDPDRQHRCSRGHAGEAFGAAGADEEAGHLRSVPLQSSRIVRLRSGGGLEVAVRKDVDPVLHAPAQERLSAVHPAIQQGDRHAASVEAGQHDRRSVGGAVGELALRQQRRGDRGGIRDADGIDAGDLRLPLEQRDRLRVERGRKAVDDTRVVVVHAHLDSMGGQRRENLLLGGDGGRGPLTLLRVGGAPARCRDALSKRRRLEHDDHALSDVDARPRAPGETAPRSGRRRERGLGHPRAARPEDDARHRDRDNR